MNGSTNKPSPEELGQRKANAEKLGNILVAAGVLDQSDLTRALTTQRMSGGRVGTILVNLRLCSEQQIRTALHEQLGIRVVQLCNLQPSADVLDLLPIELIRKYEIVPVSKIDNKLCLATLDPYNLVVIDEIKALVGVDEIEIATCTETDFNNFVAERLETQSIIHEILAEKDFYERAIQSINMQRMQGDSGEEVPTEPEKAKEQSLKVESSQPPVITFCNFLLVQAINKKASDVHIEPYEKSFRVRLRVDGRMHTLLTPPQSLHSPCISRFKIMANMDIAKRMVPQDGHIGVMHAGNTVHFRVSTLPTVYGEKCVVRLLEREHSFSSLATLGMDDGELAFVESAFRSPQGMILVTGPTGSGKTTTLHAGLSVINNQEINVITLEDPVESTIPGINHVQIHERAGLTFAGGLRSVLRQDPDVVFVGEMRDMEVASIAVKAALTGHLVLSTLHTNSAIESLVRLDDMGIPPYLVADALLTIIAQRLLRRVCEECAETRSPTADELVEFVANGIPVDSMNIRSGKGCETCLQSGYRGRVAVYEIVRVSGEMREFVRHRASVGKIVEAARKTGMTFLYEAGLKKVASGHTTLHEVQRVLYRMSAVIKPEQRPIPAVAEV